jgi:transcription elongation factor Elf1
VSAELGAPGQLLAFTCPLAQGQVNVAVDDVTLNALVLCKRCHVDFERQASSLSLCPLIQLF